MPRSEGDSGVKTGWIFEAEVRLLDIRKTHKKHINILLINFSLNLTGVLLELCDGSRALLILDFRVNHKSRKIIIAAQN